MFENNLQTILDDNALTQVQLVKATKLSRGLINKTCRKRINPRQKAKELLVSGINKLLDGKIKKAYSQNDVFPS